MKLFQLQISPSKLHGPVCQISREFPPPASYLLSKLKTLDDLKYENFCHSVYRMCIVQHRTAGEHRKIKADEKRKTFVFRIHSLVSSFLDCRSALCWNKYRESVVDLSELVLVVSLTLEKMVFHSERTAALRTQWKQNTNRP